MFTSQELQIIKAALDSITIKGSDAKVLAKLQIKVEEFLLSPDITTPDSTDKKSK